VFPDRYGNAMIEPKISRGVYNDNSSIIGIAITAQLLIYSGLTFMVGKVLLPTLLTPVYDLIHSRNYRFLVSSVMVLFAGNYLFQRLYSSQPTLNAGVISVVTRVCIANIGGLIIEHNFPNILMAVGLMLVIVGATITVYARSQL
jgi:hypothetical protein